MRKQEKPKPFRVKVLTVSGQVYEALVVITEELTPDQFSNVTMWTFELTNGNVLMLPGNKLESLEVLAEDNND